MNESAFIVGNLCSILAMITDSISATRKTAKGVLWVQTLSQVIYGCGAFVLGGYSATAQNFVSILRNLVAIYNWGNRAVEWCLVGLGVVLGLACNNLGFIGLLPVAGSLMYTLAIFRFKNDQRPLKIALIISSVMFALFNAAILNLTGAVTNSVVAVITAVNLIRTKTNREDAP